MAIDYFATIHPESKYAHQSDGKPFPVSFKSKQDGYHWVGNNNRYADGDLILLVPCSDPSENDGYAFANQPVSDQSFLGADWFKPVENRCISPVYDYIHKSGKSIY